jgi:selenide,water dikinase
VPLYDGFTDVVDRGIVSTLHRDNVKVACRVECAKAPPTWLFDPQTSGGLLAGVKANEADEVVSAMIEAGYLKAAIIGEVVATDGTQPPMIRCEGR